MLLLEVINITLYVKIIKYLISLVHILISKLMSIVKLASQYSKNFIYIIQPVLTSYLAHVSVLITTFEKWLFNANYTDFYLFILFYPPHPLVIKKNHCILYFEIIYWRDFVIIDEIKPYANCKVSHCDVCYYKINKLYIFKINKRYILALFGVWFYL